MGRSAQAVLDDPALPEAADPLPIEEPEDELPLKPAEPEPPALLEPLLPMPELLLPLRPAEPEPLAPLEPLLPMPELLPLKPAEPPADPLVEGGDVEAEPDPEAEPDAAVFSFG